MCCPLRGVRCSFVWSPAEYYQSIHSDPRLPAPTTHQLTQSIAHRTYRIVFFYLSPHTFIYFIHSDSFSIFFPPRYCWIFILFYITLCGLYSIIRRSIVEEEERKNHTARTERSKVALRRAEQKKMENERSIVKTWWKKNTKKPIYLSDITLCFICVVCGHMHLVSISSVSTAIQPGYIGMRTLGLGELAYVFVGWILALSTNKGDMYGCVYPRVMPLCCIHWISKFIACFFFFFRLVRTWVNRVAYIFDQRPLLRNATLVIKIAKHRKEPGGKKYGCMEWCTIYRWVHVYVHGGTHMRFPYLEEYSSKNHWDDVVCLPFCITKQIKQITKYSNK